MIVIVVRFFVIFSALFCYGVVYFFFIIFFSVVCFLFSVWRRPSAARNTGKLVGVGREGQEFTGRGAVATHLRCFCELPMMFAGLCGMILGGWEWRLRRCFFGQGPIYHWFAAFHDAWEREGIKNGLNWEMGKGGYGQQYCLSSSGPVRWEMLPVPWGNLRVDWNGTLSDCAAHHYKTTISFLPWSGQRENGVLEAGKGICWYGLQSCILAIVLVLIGSASQGRSASEVDARCG